VVQLSVAPDRESIAAISQVAGMLALTQAAEAKIVYTPANTPIRFVLNLDLNNDGLPDFDLCNLSSYFHSITAVLAECKPSIATLNNLH
jgi:hypothetical protein